MFTHTGGVYIRRGKGCGYIGRPRSPSDRQMSNSRWLRGGTKLNPELPFDDEGHKCVLLFQASLSHCQ